MSKTTADSAMPTLKVLGDSMDRRTVVGSLTDVRRWVFSAGVELGAPMHKLVDCVDGVAVYNTADQVGNWLKDADGEPAGLMMKSDPYGEWTATMLLRCLV